MIVKTLIKVSKNDTRIICKKSSETLTQCFLPLVLSSILHQELSTTFTYGIFMRHITYVLYTPFNKLKYIIRLIIIINESANRCFHMWVSNEVDNTDSILEQCAVILDSNPTICIWL